MHQTGMTQKNYPIGYLNEFWFGFYKFCIYCIRGVDLSDQRTPKVSVLLPVYNGEFVLAETLDSLLAQDFADFEVIIADDCSTDLTRDVVAAISDSRIRYKRNMTNLGTGGNTAEALRLARGELLFLLAQDDILLPDSLGETIRAFDLAGDVAVIIRPYYLFWDNPTVPIRVIKPFDQEKDVVIDLRDGPNVLPTLLESIGQMSGLAIRRSAMQVDFHDHVFTNHMYPIADVLRRRRAVFLHNYTVAVRIGTSQSRHHPEIYTPPPVVQWTQMVDTIFGDEEFADIHKDLYSLLGSTNYLDIMFVRCYGSWSSLIEEIGAFIKLKPSNVYNLRFVAIVVGSIVIPGPLLRWSSDIYKTRIRRRRTAKEFVF